MVGIVLDPSFVISARGRIWVNRRTSDVPVYVSAELQQSARELDETTLGHLQTPFRFFRPSLGGPLAGDVREHTAELSWARPPLSGLGGRLGLIIDQTLAPLQGGLILIGRRLEALQLAVSFDIPVLLRGPALHDELLALLAQDLTPLETESLARRARYLARWTYFGGELGEGVEVSDVGARKTR